MEIKEDVDSRQETASWGWKNDEKHDVKEGQEEEMGGKLVKEVTEISEEWRRELYR